MTEKKETPEKKEDNITETLASVKSDLDKITAANTELEAALLKQEELKARIMQGGKAVAGTTEKTPQEQAKEEASNILKTFG